MKGGRYWYWMAMGLIVVCAGCERATISGIVVDETGERLPGVAVTVEGTRDQALSDAMGEYTIQFRPRGAHVLQYRKSGFTPGMLEIDVDAPRTVQAHNVELWRVPPNSGVFLMENFRFELATPVEVSPFTIAETGPEEGTQRDPEYATSSTEPIIILYKLPPFDVRMARLERRPIQPEEGEVTEDTPTAWVLAEPVATDPVAMDQPEGLLQQLTYDGPLAPGVYAVHWGALYGEKRIEPRVFTFRITDASESEGQEGEASVAPEEPSGEHGGDSATPPPEDEDPNAPSEG